MWRSAWTIWTGPRCANGWLPHVPGLVRDVPATGPVLPQPEADRLMGLLSDERPPAPLRHGRADPDVIDRLVAHCLRARPRRPQVRL